MGRVLSPAAVLKVIRDGATGLNDVAREFIVGFGPGYKAVDSSLYILQKFIGDLASAGLIQSKDGKLTVTDQWILIQGTLGISLTSLEEGAEPGRLSVKPIFGISDASRAIPDVFVLMSFDPRFKPIYTTHISRVVKGLGLTAARADDFFTAHSVMADVWTAVHRSRVVIADCTDRNPNVFYEIGMAHTVGKPVLLITQNESDVPFDLRHIRYIKYAYTPPGMEEFEVILARTIRDLLKADTAKLATDATPGS